MHTQGLSVCSGPLIREEATGAKLGERERPDRVTDSDADAENERSEEENEAAEKEVG